ncbi:MAG: MFS transporter [Janthinobacterium lividum]
MQINKKIYHDYLIVTSIVMAVFASVMSSSMLVLCYPEIMESFHLTLKEFHWRTFFFFCSFSIGLLFFGVMAKKIGARRQFFFGMILFIISTLGSVFAPNWKIFIFCQILQALSDAMMVSTMPILIRNFISSDRLGWAFGLEATILSSSGLIGPPLGRIIAGYWGWQSIFYFLACVTFLSFVLSLYILPSFKEEIKKDLPLPYLSIFAIFSLFFSVQCLINIEDYKIGSFIGIILSIVVFVTQEFSTSTKIIPKNIIKNKPFLMCLLLIFCIATISNLLFFFTPAFLQGYLQISSTTLSWIIALDALVPIFFSTYFGKLSDRSPHKIFIVGVALYTLSLMLFSYVYLDINLWMLTGIYMVLGFGSALMSPSQMKLTISIIPFSETGTYMGLYYFVQFSCGSFATIIFMAITSSDSLSYIRLTPQDFKSILLFSTLTMLVVLYGGFLRNRFNFLALSKISHDKDL